VVRGGEVELDSGRLLDLLVGVGLGAVVRSDRRDPTTVPLDEFDHARDRVDRAVPRELAHHEVAGGPLHEGDDTVASVLVSHHRVDLPVTDLASLLDLGWPLGDAAFTCESPAPVAGPVALARPLARLAQMVPEVPAGALVGAHMDVDRLMADAQDPLGLEEARDLLG